MCRPTAVVYRIGVSYTCVDVELFAFQVLIFRSGISSASVLHVTYTVHVIHKMCSLLFTALHGMQTRSSDENSVRPSVRLSNAWIVKKNERKLCSDFYIIRKNIYPSFVRRRMVGGGDPFYLKPALERNRRYGTDNLYSLVAPQLYDLAKKVQLTLIGSPLLAFR